MTAALAWTAVALSLAACTTTRASAHLPALHTTPSATPEPDTGGPAWFAVLHRGRLQWYDSVTARPLGSTATPSGATLTAIAPWGDGHSVVAAARVTHTRACASILLRQQVDSGSGLSVLPVPGIRDIAGVVDLLAVSPDHGKLAVVMHVAGDKDRACDRVELLVADLRTGARRVWTLPYSPGPAPKGVFRYYYNSSFVSVIAWAPDNRRLVVHYGQCCADGGGIWVLDTAAAPGPLLSRLPPRPRDELCLQQMPYAWTADGVVASDELTGCDGGDGDGATLVTVDVTTGTARPLVTSSAISVVSAVCPDATGKHLLVYAESTLYRVDGPSVRRLMALPWNGDSPTMVAW